MTIAQKIAVRIAALCLVLMFNACGTDYSAAVVGTWKDISQERYLVIEKTDGSGGDFIENAGNISALSTANKEKYRAIIYAPNSSAMDNAEAWIAMNHMSMPARVQDGIMTIKLEAGDIAVLYDPNNQQVVLNGTDKYQRVSEDIAQLKLDTGTAVNRR